MKVYKTQQEVEADIKDGVLAIKGDVKFECSICILASIVVTAGDINAWDITALNINARDINARDINAWDINARDINARDINARNINAWDITALNINARNINARDINAWDITARNINARDILYNALCFVYRSIKCVSIKAKREIYKEPICLEGSLEIRNQKKTELLKKADGLIAKAQELKEEAEKIG